MSSFDQSGVTGLIGLWEFNNGNPDGDTGLADGLAQDGTFENGASATGGRAVFDGNNDRFDVEGDNGGQLESEFDLGRGVLETQFTSNPNEALSDSTIVNRGEFSDMNEEGWFGIRVTGDGKVIVQHCPIGPDGTRIDAFLDTPPNFFSAGDTINVNYEWDESTGATATITNVTTGDTFTESSSQTGLTLDIGDNDDEIFTFGAREEDDGDYDQHFDGSIDYVAVYESAVTEPNPDFEPTTREDLVSLWEMSENGSDTAIDTAGVDQTDGTTMGDAFMSNNELQLDGNGDYLLIPAADEHQLDAGRIELVFNQDAQVGTSPDTILSRDSTNFDDGGHFTLQVTQDGAVTVRHQTDAESVFFETPDDFFDPGDDVRVSYSWDQGGEGGTFQVENLSTGATFEEPVPNTLTMDMGPNFNEPWTVGASQVVSSDNTADNLREFFDGEISYVAIYDSATPPADPNGVVDGEAFDEVMELDYDDANNPTDGGGDLITTGDDVIFGNGGSDTIDGDDGDDTIFGDSEDAGPPADRQIFEWGDAPGFGDGATADDFTQDTGAANISFSIISQTGDVTNTYETTTQNTDGLDAEVAENESFDSLLRDEDDTVTYGWSSDVPVENVEFRVNDIDGDGVVQVRAFDPDGNPIEVVLSDVGSDLAASDTDGVAGNDQVASIDDDYTEDDNPIHSVIVTIPGPVGSWEVIHSMSGDNDSGINFTDITFDIAQPDLGVPGDDVITGGAGADVMFGQDGDDTFIVDTASDGDGDVVDGGNGPDDSADNDTLDLRGAGQVTIDDDVDPNDDGARAGTVTFESGEVLTFSGIETILTDPQNEAPDVIASDVTIDENTTDVQDVDATDPDGDTVEFSITGGADAALFEIDPVTGQLDFIDAPDFENPLDDDGDNVYEVEVTATDPGNLSDSQLVNVTVANVNEAPDVTGPATVDVDENVTGVIADFDATDPDLGDNVTFSLTGDDAALFDIDPTTGELSFVNPPDFENPEDADGDNVYDVTVVGTDDGGLTDEQDVQVTVGDVDENGAPDVIANDVTIDENTTDVQDVDANDPDGDTVEFSITGGADAALFEINPTTGQLDFINAPDFETPLDDDGDNVYEVEVTATDPGNLSDSQLVNVTVANVNEAPDVTGPATVGVDENVTGVIADFDATDPDAGDNVTFSLTGDDAALFTIDPDTGELSFINPPDFENPEDADGDNEYEVTVVGTDDGGLTDEQDVVITVADVDETDGIVDGEESGELMGPGYDDSNAPTDQGGDIIDGPDGLDDVIEGNGGNDTIDSGEGDDTVDGGSGDDVFDINDEGEGIDNDVITGGEAGETDGDTIDTGDIDDDLTVTFTGNEEGTITDGTDTTTFEEIENVQLGGGDDTVIGSDANTESVDGGAGDDVMSGGDGSDTLAGGDDNDSITGGLGGDSLSGDDGNDTLEGDQGIDTIDGGDGDDSIDGGSGVDSLDGGDGDDTILGGSQSDTIDGGDGEDEIDGGTGSDVILSSDGADTIDGGAGTDTYRDDTDETIEVTVDDNGDGTVERVNDGTTDTVEDFENFVAGESPAEADVITLTTPIPVDDIATEIQGLDDNAVGTFTPADGGPVVSFGGPGEPALSDIFALPQPAGEYQITDGDEDGQIGDISFENFETINFTITGANPDGAVDGEETGELMGPGYDDSNAPTDQGGDIIDGPDGLDDTIFGNGGDDTIDSGEGDDTVDGGAGDDVFDINDEGAGIDNDVITGSETDEDDGGDTIDTTDIDDDLDVVFTAPEEGTITDGTDTTTFEEIENLQLGGGDDSVTGSDGDENVDGGGGDDTMDGGDGEDTLSGGDGNDDIDGGDGDDVLDGGEGNDTIDGGAGSDTVTDLEGDNVIDTSDPDILTALPDRGFDGYGPVPPIPEDADSENDRDSVTTGSGNDSITTGDDDDTIISGAGNDTINSGIDDDFVDAGTGADLITTGEGSDTVLGGGGNDTIFGGLGPTVPDGADIPDDGTGPFGPDPDPDNGRDSLDGGLGNDLIFGEDDDDTLIGGGGNDTLDGGIDDDDLDGGVGFDSLIGGQGNDTLDGGRGRDTLEGGIGNDVFVETANEGADLITDFGLGNTGSINDGDQTNNDFVDLSEFYNDTTLAAVNANATNPANQFNDPLSMLRADAEDGILDGIINGENLQAFIPGISLRIDNGGVAVTGSDLTFDNTNVACFVRGTQIATRRGSVAIEDLKAGDEVITMDHGFQQIRWIGSTSVPATGALAPVVIRKGAMGNERDLRVSPQHRMLVRGWHVELMFGQKEALVPAKALINDETVFPLEGGTVDYFHMMFDRHELVYAEGVPSESFHPGHVGLGSFAEDTREEILTLFPELRADAGGYSEHVRPSLKVREAKVLAENPELLKE